MKENINYYYLEEVPMRYKRFLTMAVGFLLLFFILTPTSHAENGQTYEVEADSLNVRSAPSHSAEVIGQLDDGNRIVAFQEAFGWVQTYYDGQEAWVASQFLYQTDSEPNTKLTVSQKEVTVTASDVRLRVGPGTQHDIMGYTSKGDTYKLVETSNDWHKVSLDDKSTAWIAAWLTNTDSDSNQPAKTTTDKNTKATKQSNGSLNGYNFVLDPGHGGKDPGAIGIGGVFEKDFIMPTADKVAKKLRNAGATVTMTRTSNYFISLEDRVKLSNSHNAHAFISLHFNASPVLTVNGLSTYFHSGGDNRVLAQDIQTAISQKTPLQSRGIMQNDYHVLRENSNLAVLLELGFITNPYDLATIQTSEYKSNVAAGIVEGLKNYFDE